jgi:hypothetical protein
MQNSSLWRVRLNRGHALVQRAYESIFDFTSASECVLSSLELKLPRDSVRKMEREEESRDENVGLKLLGGGALVLPLLGESCLAAAKG